MNITPARRAHLKLISRKGGLARIRIHGNPGTIDGRKRGGLNSVLTHRKENTGFKVLQHIKKPRNSKKLAELMGILMGDGHLGMYQISVVTNSETDVEHAYFTKNLLKQVFHLPVSIKKRAKEKALVVLLSSKEAVRMLHTKGMPLGHKIRAKMKIPQWIKGDLHYSRSFIRGLFDTDGCVFADHHFRSKKKYSYIGWTITSNADTFILDVERLLRNMGFLVTHRSSQNSIFLRRQKEVIKYFSLIGTHNPKHSLRYRNFCKLQGRVPKRS